MLLHTTQTYAQNSGGHLTQISMAGILGLMMTEQKGFIMKIFTGERHIKTIKGRLALGYRHIR